jgi:hypothetical protein
VSAPVGVDPHDVIQRAEDTLAGGNARWAQLHLRNAELVRDAGTGSARPELVAAVVHDAEENGLTSSAAYARFAACFHAAVLHSPELIESAREELLLSVRGAEFSYLLELSYLMSGDLPPQDLPRAHWIDGPEEAAARCGGVGGLHSLRGAPRVGLTLKSVRR